MDILKQTKELCRLYDITPARSRGQNFLINEQVYDKIIETAELKSEDNILEVGPGLGFLTTKMAVGANGHSPVQKVIAVELDNKLAEVLKVGLIAKKIDNVEAVNEDILKFQPHPTLSKFLPRRMIRGGEGCEQSERGEEGAYKIVANLPYNITSIFLRKFLSGERKPELMVLMLQQEVAERIVAKPPKMSLLAVSVQFYAKAEIIDYVPKANFWPEPEVDSAIIKITPTLPSPAAFLAREGSIDYKVKKLAPFSHEEMNGRKVGIEGSVDKEKDFFRLVKIGFSARRKMLKNNLAAGLRINQAVAVNKLKMAGFNEKIRAQELSVQDWLRLFGEFKEFMV